MEQGVVWTSRRGCTVSGRLVGGGFWDAYYSLLNDEQEGLNRFAASVKDIQLFIRTYSHSGN
jgi:hypothetical protein